MKQLHSRAIWLFFITSFFRWFFLFLIAVFWGLAVFFNEGANIIKFSFNFFSSAGFITFIIFLITLYIWARLSYHFYRYELTESGFRKEFRVIWKKYVTIPYDRIQNVDIYRGPLARILGLSDLNIQTAGISYVGKYGAATEGRLPGLSIEEAESLRNELISRIDKSHQGGL